MNNYVLLVVRTTGLKPCYLQFTEDSYVDEDDYVHDVYYVKDIDDATTYPTYEAAEAVLKYISDSPEFLYVKIFDTYGNAVDVTDDDSWEEDVVVK